MRFWSSPISVVFVCIIGIASAAIAESIPISSMLELYWIGNRPESPLDGVYHLTTDLDATDTVNWNAGSGFMPIGTEATPFTGIFDGNGYTITGLYINRSISDYVGLYGVVASRGSIWNLTLQDCAITGKNYVGGLVGLTNGSLENCTVNGDVSGNEYVGGLAGRNNGSVSNCHSTGNVDSSGVNYAGGLLGYLYFGSVANSSSASDVTGAQRVGGLAGHVHGATITECYSTGRVIGIEGGYWGIGGLIGSDDGSTITNCYATGAVTGNNYVGGLVGLSGNSLVKSAITSCYATGAIEGNSRVGGLIGYHGVTSLTSCYATGAVKGTSKVGGLVGDYDSWDSSLMMTECYASGEVIGDEDEIGGLIGSIGYFSKASKNYSSGSVRGRTKVGGLIGNVCSGYPDISDCFAVGSVTGTASVGGLVGANIGTVRRCYAAGQVNGPAAAGGLVGETTVSIETSYWDLGTSGVTVSAGGTGKTTAQMIQEATFYLPPMNTEWNFSNIWTIEDGASYPYFQYMTGIGGNFTVLLEPEAARVAGAQWCFFGDSSWRDSGDDVIGLPTRIYPVKFKEVEGFPTPVTRPIAILPDMDSSVIVYYGESGPEGEGEMSEGETLNEGEGEGESEGEGEPADGEGESLSEGEPPTLDYPQSFTAASGPDYTLLRWLPNLDDRLRGYRLYRRVGDSGIFTLLAEPNNTATRYTDGDVVPGQRYYYQLSAVVGGVESDRTPAVSAVAGALELSLDTVELSAGACGAFGVNVANVTGVTVQDIEITIAFDPTVLDADTITVKRTVITRGMPMYVTVEPVGRLTIVVSNSVPVTLVGEGRMFHLEACVLADVPAGACSALAFQNISIISGTALAIPVESAVAGELCVRQACGAPGDVDGDGSVTQEDAKLVLDIAVRKLMPTECHWKTGELTGDARIDSADAVMVMRMVRDLAMVPEDGDRTLADLWASGSPVIELAVPYEITAMPGETIDVPVSLKNGAGLAGLDMSVTFPPTSAGLTLEAFEAGMVVGNFIQRDYQGERFLRMGFASDRPFTSGKAEDDTLVVLRFRVAGTALAGTSFPINLQGTKLSGAFGENFDWYTDVVLLGGIISVAVAQEPNPEGEGEAQAEGETDDENGATGGCCRRGCGKEKDMPGTVDAMRRFLGDWLLMGVSLVVLLALASWSGHK